MNKSTINFVGIRNNHGFMKLNKRERNFQELAHEQWWKVLTYSWEVVKTS